MAINGTEKTKVDASQTTANVGAAQNYEQPKMEMNNNPFGGSIGFGSRDIFTMYANQGSDYTTGLAKAIMETYKNIPSAIRPRVSILDKEVINNLAYSAIVVSTLSDNEVNYFTILLEATGRKAMRASEIISEVNAANKMQGQRPMIYTTDDAIDSVLHQEIRTALEKEYGRVAIQSVDGMVVPVNHQEITAVTPKIAAIAYNACAVDAALAKGDVKDLNITEAKNKTNNSVLRLESNMSRLPAINEVGAPVRADWKIDLNIVDMASQMTSLNLQNNKITLAKTAGFVDAIPEEVATPTMPGMPPVTNIRLRPHIVVTNNATFTPTTGYMLLGLISSLVMTNKNMWLAAVMPKDSKNNVGALNLMTNLENNQNRIGSVLDLGSKKNTTDEIYALIKQMFALDPMVSMDVASFGPQTFYTSILATAAQPGNAKAKMHAAKELVQVASWLTSGHFPADFHINEIFANSGVIVPTGTWADKTGERDIRDIDLAFIASQTGDMTLMNRWVLSNLPKEASGLDPYLTKVDIISKIVPDAEINGKAVRVTFSSKFITTLVNAAAAAGLDARYEPEIKFVESNNISIMGNYLANAGITNASGFAREHINAGPSFATQYSGMGQFRW